MLGKAQSVKEGMGDRCKSVKSGKAYEKFLQLVEKRGRYRLSNALKIVTQIFPAKSPQNRHRFLLNSV